MRRLLSYEILYILFGFSVAFSIYFVKTDEIRIIEACTINLSLLALAVSTHSNHNTQLDKVKEIVREHLLLLYDALLLTARHLEEDLAHMEEVYTDLEALNKHLSILAREKADITRLSSRLSFFINEKDFCTEADLLNREIDILVATIEAYRLNDLPAVMDLVKHLRANSETSTNIKEGLKASIASYQSVLSDIEAQEKALLRDLTEGRMIEKLQSFRTLEKINLTR